MSKESSIPLTRRVLTDPERDEYLVVDERYRRYPVTDRKVAKALNLSEDGHNVPPPSSRRNRGR